MTRMLSKVLNLTLFLHCSGSRIIWPASLWKSYIYRERNPKDFFMSHADSNLSKVNRLTKNGEVGLFKMYLKLQSTLVISKSRGLYETLRDILTSTNQICGTEENS